MIMPSGYVYAISDTSGGIKLGLAENPDDRVKQLQTGNKEQLTIIYRLYVEDMKHAEDSLHLIFAGRRVNGEWFKLTEQEVALLELIFNARECNPIEKRRLEILGLR